MFFMMLQKLLEMNPLRIAELQGLAQGGFYCVKELKLSTGLSD